MLIAQLRNNKKITICGKGLCTLKKGTEVELNNIILNFKDGTVECSCYVPEVKLHIIMPMQDINGSFEYLVETDPENKYECKRR